MRDNDRLYPVPGLNVSDDRISPIWIILFKRQNTRFVNQGFFYQTQNFFIPAFLNKLEYKKKNQRTILEKSNIWAIKQRKERHAVPANCTATACNKEKGQSKKLFKRY